METVRGKEPVLRAVHKTIKKTKFTGRKQMLRRGHNRPKKGQRIGEKEPVLRVAHKRKMENKKRLPKKMPETYLWACRPEQ